MITIQTNQKRQVIDITDQIEGQINGDGLVYVLLKHTTAAITLADLDPGTDKDYLKALEQMTPPGPWQHPHDPDHFPDHLWSSLIGQSVTVPFQDSKLRLGSWQRLILIELDGPRDREIELSIIAK
jgi:secondary thiamine-phosphate synthase enzyme